METNLCPHCQGAILPTDDMCQSCFTPLNQSSAPSPGTMSMERKVSSGFPDTKLEKPIPDMVDPYSSGAPESASDAVQPQVENNQRWEEGPGGFDLQPPAQESLPQDQVTANSEMQISHSFGPEPAKESETNPNRAGDNAVRYRPQLRPPMAVLGIFDDDLKSVESVRLRAQEVTIGRQECDVVIPHDRMMSSKHAKLSCVFEDDYYKWYLEDLKSTNGTFVRIKSAKIHHKQELFVGSYRYRFNAAPQGAAEIQPLQEPQSTLGWKKVDPKDLEEFKPSLIQLRNNGEEINIPLVGNDQVIGSDPNQADIVLEDNPTVSSKHFRIFQDKHRRWFVEDLGSLNHLWLSVDDKQEIDMNTQFQLGEQRFVIRFP